MKKQIIISALVCLITLVGHANSYSTSTQKKRGKLAFRQGQVTTHLGLGLITPGRYGKMGYEYYGANEYKRKLAFNLMGDYGVTDFLSVGVFANFGGEEVTITDNTNPNNIYGFKNKFKLFGLKGSYHQNIGNEKIDPFASLTMGFNSCKAEAFGELNYLDAYKGGFAWALQAGANYYFTKNIGAYLEAGYGRWIPIINLGITARI